MKNKKYKIGYQRNPKLTNQFAPGGFLNTLNKWGDSIFGKDDSYSGKGLNSGGMGVANLGASVLGSASNALINKDGLSSGAGDIMSTVGQAASAIPGVGGLVGAGVNVLGGLTNKAFGSKINQEFVDNTEMGIKQLGNTQYMGNTSDSLMDEFQSTNFMNDVSRNQVGKDGWFSNRAKKKANKLNRQIDEAEERALNNFGLSTSNLATNNILTGMSNYFANGGSLDTKPQRRIFDLPLDRKGNPLLSESNIQSDYSSSGLLYPISKALRNHNREKEPNKLYSNKYSKGGPLDKSSFEDWYKTIPTDRNDTTSYNLKRAYELAPKEELESWRTSSYKDLENGKNHLRTVYENPKTGIYEFVKSKNHPTLKKELDWYYSDTPDSNDFRDNYDLDTSEEYYKYVPKNKRSYGGSIIRGITDLDTGMTIPELNPRIKLLEKGGNLNSNYKTVNHNMRKNIFNNGGILNSLESGFGSDFSNGLKHINAGGKHEQNPNEGVLMGFDQKGIPNLVEEGEVIFNDYVFSNRLEPTEEDLLIYKLPTSFLGKTYAEIAKKLSEESQERPNDPISERGLSASMSKLVQAQENTKYKMDSKANAKEIDALSLEDLNIYASALESQEEEQMVQEDKAIQQMEQEQMMQEQIGGNPGIPNMFATGGVLDFSKGNMRYTNPNSVDWGKRTPNLKNHTDWQNARRWTGITEAPVNYNKFLNPDRYFGFMDSKDVSYFGSKPHAQNAILGQGTETQSLITTPSNKETIVRDNKGLQSSTRRYSTPQTQESKSLILPELSSTPHGYINKEQADASINLQDKLTSPVDSPIGLYKTRNERGSADQRSSSKLANLRYAPVIGSGISVLSDLLGVTNKPDYSSADAIVDATNNLRKVSAPKIGDYMSYNPFDTDYYTNQLDAANAGVRSTIQNTSGGNRASAQASLLAADHNANMQRGALVRQAAESNLQQRQIVSDFNRNTNMQNAQMDLQAQMANQNVDQIKMNALAQRAQLRDAANARADEARAFNLSNFFNNLGGVGREEYMRNSIMNNPSLLYALDRLGNVRHKESSDNKSKKK